MKTNNITPNNSNNGRMVAGIIILTVGCLLLTRHLGMFFFPHWLFSWPMWLIGIGIYIGAKHNFTKPSWIWMVGLGTAFLVTENVPDGGHFVWPFMIIALGIWIVMRQNNGHNNSKPDKNFTDYTEVK